MAENETNKKKKVAIITASIVAVVAVLFLAIFLPIYLSQKSEETVESNLPSGSTLNELIKGSDSNYEEANTTVKRIVFDYYDKDESGDYTQTESGNYTYTEDDVNVLEEQEAESYTWNDVQIDVYRVSDGDKTTVYFLSTEDIVANEDMSYSFYNFTSVEEIAFNNFDTSIVTSMNNMFCLCTSLTILDVSKWNTSNVTDMAELFNECNSLSSIDLSNFDTSKVTTISAMFRKCTSLTNLDLSNFDTSNMTNFAYLFEHCTTLVELDISGWDTSNVTNMKAMFFNNTSMTTPLDLSHFDTSNVTDMSMMFAYCRFLTELDISSFDTSKVTNMKQMFDTCSALEVIYIGEGWTIDALEDGNDTNMFFNCTSLPNYIINERVYDKTYAYAGYSEELEAYGYLTLKTDDQSVED